MSVFDAADLRRAHTRIAHEIVERNHGADDVVLVGLHTRGVGARRAASPTRSRRSRTSTVPVGTLDVAFYRDDIGLRPVQPARSDRGPGRHRPARSSCSSTTCSSPAAPSAPRSTRSPSSAGPRAVQLAVLVDRGHRELPIRADYVGKNLPTGVGEDVRVRLAEIDGVDDDASSCGDPKRRGASA